MLTGPVNTDGLWQCGETFAKVSREIERLVFQLREWLVLSLELSTYMADCNDTTGGEDCANVIFTVD